MSKNNKFEPFSRFFWQKNETKELLEVTSQAQVVEIIDGVQKLSNLDKMKFRYYKSFKSNDTNPESLAEVIPLDNDAYDIKVNENNMENYKNFFNKSYIDSIEMLNDVKKSL